MVVLLDARHSMMEMKRTLFFAAGLPELCGEGALVLVFALFGGLGVCCGRGAVASFCVVTDEVSDPGSLIFASVKILESISCLEAFFELFDGLNKAISNYYPQK